MICENCEGTGELPCPTCNNDDPDTDVECEQCSGIGFLLCENCGGTGELGEIEA